MLISWPEFWGRCKSGLSAIGRECFLTRAKWRDRARSLNRDVKKLRRKVTKLSTSNDLLQKKIESLEAELAEQKQNRQPVALGTEVQAIKPKGCHYTDHDMALAVNLARKIGLRPAVAAMAIFYKWLDWDEKVPTYQTVRSWMLRIGLDRVEHAPKVEGSTWLVDHTCQMGKEKVLTILRVRSSNSLKKNRPLKLADMELLAEVSRTSWAHADVLQVFEATSKKYGAPGAILSDQAADLQKPACALKNTHKNLIVLTDFKHFLANQFRLILEQDTDYLEFTKQHQYTSACVQQTELSHFVPRLLKRKSRFMNLGPVLQWADAMLWHLSHPESRSRADIPQERMEAKFGWLRGLKSQIDQWQQCQAIIDAGVHLIDTKGLSHRTAGAFRELTVPLANCAVSRKLADLAINFLQSQASQLNEGQQVPLSTEIIESVFARYKSLEKQHSQEGFSGLLLALGTLLQPATEKEIIRAFARTKCKQTTQWITTNLGRTHASKRQNVFRECRSQTKRNQIHATAIAA